MSRLAGAFHRENEVAVIPFLAAGDPDLDTTVAVALEFARCGAAAIELGIPFSDPVADGAAVQQAYERALANGVCVADVIEVVRRIRAESQVPLVLFTYLNPALQYGFERFAQHAAEAGADGVLLCDVPVEEAGEFAPVLRARGLDPIFLVAPTTSDARLAEVARQASGFLYAVSMNSVTGGSKSLAAARPLVERVRAVSKIPVAVGFGIGTAGQVSEVCEFADAAVVGSALVRAVAAEAEQGLAGADLARVLGNRLQELLAGRVCR